MSSTQRRGERARGAESLARRSLCSSPLCAPFLPPLRAPPSPRREKLSFVPIFEPPKAYPPRGIRLHGGPDPSMATNSRSNSASWKLLQSSHAHPPGGPPPDAPRRCPFHPHPRSTPPPHGHALARRPQLAGDSSRPPPPLPLSGLTKSRALSAGVRRH